MNRIQISGFTLKCLAAVTMLADHIGAVMFPEYVWLRCIGRLAFPLYCFLLAEGFVHTKDIRKYIVRLGLLAVVSEPIADLAFYGKGVYWSYQNVYWTLLMGMLALVCLTKFYQTSRYGYMMLVCCMAIIAELAHTDYGMLGVVLIVVFYIYRQKVNYRDFGVVALNVLMLDTQGIQILGSLALIPIHLYNHKRGYTSKWVQWGFYLFYPLHLGLLALIALV